MRIGRHAVASCLLYSWTTTIKGASRSEGFVRAFHPTTSYSSSNRRAIATTTLTRTPRHQQEHSPRTTNRRMASTDNNDDGAATTTTPEIDIAANVELVKQNMAAAAAASGLDPEKIRLVAVSKTKPLALLQQAYDQAGTRVFGENYVQELVEKVPQMPSDCVWHFIGNLQSNKVNMLLGPFWKQAGDLDRLVLETVSTLKLARKLNNAIQQAQQDKTDDDNNPRLKIFCQVNTSGEASKSGVAPDEVAELCQAIVAECPRLQLIGLMTIGAPGDESCLDQLVECQRQVSDALALPLELSMGMSGDYQVAIQKGSTNVRVGSTIFGARDYSNVNKA